MPPLPLVQFKAGRCHISDDSRPRKVKPEKAAGFIYLYKEDDLAHFCWRPRASPIDYTGSDSLDLIMLPGDGHFEPYKADELGANGRIYQLGFESSRVKHFFWLQSKSQHPDGKSDHWSESDFLLGKIVGEILNGEDVDARQMYQSAKTGLDQSRHGNNDDEDDDDDAEMKDAGDGDDGPSSTGGAGAGATGGNVAEEGEESRQGGEDGARALAEGRDSGRSQIHSNAHAAVANLLKSLKGDSKLTSQATLTSSGGERFATLSDLLFPEIVMGAVDQTGEDKLNHLLAELPPQLVLFERNLGNTDINHLSDEAAHSAIGSLSVEEKKRILKKVSRSPQFVQSLSGLTVALQDGGLPILCEVLNIRLANVDIRQQGRMPAGDEDAVKLFLDGVKNSVENDDKEHEQLPDK